MAESTFLTLGAMAFSPSVEVDVDVSKKVSLRLMEMEKLIIEEHVLEAGTARSFMLNENDRESGSGSPKLHTK